eukprot:GHVL01039933.1.p1 GENE.GHVL01039933.1~~GHVL01039933.1.p1  ORF type:complete len:373 (+),score=90.95 GHVL01039933.1:15-1133(+)
MSTMKLNGKRKSTRLEKKMESLDKMSEDETSELAIEETKEEKKDAKKKEEKKEDKGSPPSVASKKPKSRSKKPENPSESGGKYKSQKRPQQRDSLILSRPNLQSLDRLSDAASESSVRDEDKTTVCDDKTLSPSIEDLVDPTEAKTEEVFTEDEEESINRGLPARGSPARGSPARRLTTDFNMEEFQRDMKKSASSDWRRHIKLPIMTLVVVVLSVAFAVSKVSQKNERLKIKEGWWAGRFFEVTNTDSPSFVSHIELGVDKSSKSVECFYTSILGGIKEDNDIRIGGVLIKMGSGSMKNLVWNVPVTISHTNTLVDFLQDLKISFQNCNIKRECTLNTLEKSLSIEELSNENVSSAMCTGPAGDFISFEFK